MRNLPLIFVLDGSFEIKAVSNSRNADETTYSQINCFFSTDRIVELLCSKGELAS